MTDESAPKPKIIVDEDWKSQVQAERENLAKQPEQTPHQEAAEAGTGSMAQPDDLPLPAASLSVLVTTLATQAMLALGQAPMPDEKKLVVNLPFAKHCIDTLGILADKTKGNLTPSEDGLLSRFLYELRMLYVAVQNQLKKPTSATPRADDPAAGMQPEINPVGE